MSLLDEIYGDNNSFVPDVAFDQATPNRICKAFMRLRIETAISEHTFQLNDEQMKTMVGAF